MTPKEKADQLLRKFTLDFTMDFNLSKEAALICVNEIIESNLDFDHDDNIWCDTRRYRNATIYWGKVKEEIEKL